MPRKSAEVILSATGSIVFIMLDLLDFVMSIIFRIVDRLFEGKTSPCYSENRGEKVTSLFVEGEREMSETLYGRKNIFCEMGVLGRKTIESGFVGSSNRWSDCGCNACVSWMNKDDQKLHVVVKEPLKATDEDSENVIFIHGMLSSSLFWTERVFCNVSESTKSNYRLLAVDLLGFGNSPKPRECFYTLTDHLGAIEKSVIDPFQLKSFHLVAHSMGCIVALALAAKYSKSVKSITLLAPPYFASPKDTASITALSRIAEKRLRTPLLFVVSVLSLYEHLCRSTCFLLCRNHRTWETILRFLTRKSDGHLMIMDMTRHTHHSVWHNMHNVVCGGAKLIAEYLEALSESKVKINVFQGSRDQIIPLECSDNIKMKVPKAEVHILPDADHSTIVVGREKEFTLHLERIWASVVDGTKRGECSLPNGNSCE